MNGKVHYTTCPVCYNSNIQPLLTIKDESISKENFEVWQCKQCLLQFTQDAPTEETIGPYYKSPDYISHSNTSKGLLNKLYQKVRQFTLNQKANLIIRATGLKQGSILDVGCGTGSFIHTMQKKNWQIEGIEPDEDARKLAKDNFQLSVKEPSALFQFAPSSLDAITLWHVLEHVHDLHNYIEQLKLLLKKDGVLFIAVPNYQSLDAAIYNLKWAAYDVPRHLYHFIPKTIQELMQLHGMNVVAKKPMWFDAFYICLLSSKYKNGYTNWLGAIINGLRSNINTLLNNDRCSSLIYVISKNSREIV